jgi:hypothetical protein
MKVKIFERSGEPGRLEREINDFLAILGFPSGGGRLVGLA